MSVERAADDARGLGEVAADRHHATIDRWVAAELAGDAETLGPLLADDYHGIGPAGFVLPRVAWLARFENGLVNHALAIEDRQVRTYGDAAIVIGTWVQDTHWKDHHNPGSFRTSIVLVRGEGGWVVAGMQLSPIAGR